MENKKKKESHSLQLLFVTEGANVRVLFLLQKNRESG